MDFDKICRLCITPTMNMNYPMNFFNESEFNRNVAKVMHEHMGHMNQVCQPHAIPKPIHHTQPPPPPPPVIPPVMQPPPSNHRIHTEICEFCSKPFSSRNDLFSHIQKVHTKVNTKNSYNSDRREKFQCTICNAWLASRHTLKTHIQNHSSEPKKCPHCDKISPTRNALTTHIRGVHTERSHKCHLCEKSFKAATALKDHIATHTGEKSYKCSFCPESFIWRPNMYSHRKRAHPNEWNESKRQRESN